MICNLQVRQEVTQIKIFCLVLILYVSLAFLLLTLYLYLGVIAISFFCNYYIVIPFETWLVSTAPSFIVSVVAFTDEECSFVFVAAF